MKERFDAVLTKNYLKLDGRTEGSFVKAVVHVREALRGQDDGLLKGIFEGLFPF